MLKRDVMRTEPAALWMHAGCTMLAVLMSQLTLSARPQAVQQQRFPLAAKTVTLSIEPVLAGLRQVTVTIDGLNDDIRRRCSLNESSLRLAVARPLLDGGLRVLEKRPFNENWSPAEMEQWMSEQAPDVYVNVNGFIISSSTCVASVSLLLQSRELAALPHREGAYGELVLTHANVVLESFAVLMTGPGADFGDRVGSWLRSRSDELVTAIKLASQRGQN